jgi:hypothetical protein
MDGTACIQHELRGAWAALYIRAALAIGTAAVSAFGKILGKVLSGPSVSRHINRLVYAGSTASTFLLAGKSREKNGMVSGR